MFFRKTSLLSTLILAIVGVAIATESADAQRRFQIGGPFGVGIGGGQGLTIGGGYGVQLGGGQGLRFGPPNAGVQYGGGQGVRYGTRNFGVQYGGGQLLRYGTPNAGVRIGGGEGLRVGTTQSGVQFGNGNGLQVGRYANPTGPAPQIIQPIIPVQPRPVIYGQPVYPGQLNPPIQGFQQTPLQPGVVISPNTMSPNVIPPNSISNTPTRIAPATPIVPAQNIVPSTPQTQFDAARQATTVPSSAAKPVLKTPTENPSDEEGVSVLKRD